MKALLITPASKSVEMVEIDSVDDIKSLIGFDTIDYDDIGPAGDRLYFDEECFIRGDAVSGRFQVDKVAPVAGKGIVVGSSEDGALLRDAVSDIASLKARLVYL